MRQHTLKEFYDVLQAMQLAMREKDLSSSTAHGWVGLYGDEVAITLRASEPYSSTKKYYKQERSFIGKVSELQKLVQQAWGFIAKIPSKTDREMIVVLQAISGVIEVLPIDEAYEPLRQLLLQKSKELSQNAITHLTTSTPNSDEEIPF